MNEKSVSISVYIENKTTKIRRSPCVHITFCTEVTFRYLWMLTSYVTGGCCHISVVSECYGSTLRYINFVKHFLLSSNVYKKELKEGVEERCCPKLAIFFLDVFHFVA